MDEIKILKIEEEVLEKVSIIHKNAFKDYSSTKLGDYYIHKVLEWFIKNKEAINFCAFLNSEPVGYIIGAPAGYHIELRKKTFFPALFSLFCRLYLIFDFKFLKKVYFVLKNLLFSKRKPTIDFPTPVFSLVGIGVLSQASGKGIGNLLMDKFEEEVKERNFKTITLTVFKNNIVARKLYEKRIWKPIDTKYDYLIYYKEL